MRSSGRSARTSCPDRAASPLSAHSAAAAALDALSLHDARPISSASPVMSMSSPGVAAGGWSSKAVPPPKTVTVRDSACARAMSSESSAMLSGLASRGSSAAVRLIPTSVCAVSSRVSSVAKNAPEVGALGTDFGGVRRGQTPHLWRRSDAGPPVRAPGGLDSGRAGTGRLRRRAVPAPGDFDSGHAGVGRQGEEVDVVGSDRDRDEGVGGVLPTGVVTGQLRDLLGDDALDEALGHLLTGVEGDSGIEPLPHLGPGDLRGRGVLHEAVDGHGAVALEPGAQVLDAAGD